MRFNFNSGVNYDNRNFFARICLNLTSQVILEYCKSPPNSKLCQSLRYPERFEVKLFFLYEKINEVV